MNFQNPVSVAEIALKYGLKLYGDASLFAQDDALEVLETILRELFGDAIKADKTTGRVNLELRGTTNRQERGRRGGVDTQVTGAVGHEKNMTVAAGSGQSEVTGGGLDGLSPG